MVTSQQQKESQKWVSFYVITSHALVKYNGLKLLKRSCSCQIQRPPAQKKKEKTMLLFRYNGLKP